MKIISRDINRDAVEAYLAGRSTVTLAEISRDVLGHQVEPGSKSVPGNPAIVRALRSLGWVRRGTSSKRWWEKPLLATALVLRMASSAHAASWIIVATSADAPADGKMIPAYVGPNVYSSEAQCWYYKGRLEGAFSMAGSTTANIWCATVPGLVTRR